METVSALLAICAGNSPVPGEFPAQRPVTRGFDVFFDLRPDKHLSKQSWGWWSETPSHSLWRHRNENNGHGVVFLHTTIWLDLGTDITGDDIPPSSGSRDGIGRWRYVRLWVGKYTFKTNIFQWNFNQKSNIFIQENAFEYVICQKSVICSQCVRRRNWQGYFHISTYSTCWLMILDENHRFYDETISIYTGKSTRKHHGWCTTHIWVIELQWNTTKLSKIPWCF